MDGTIYNSLPILLVSGKDKEATSFLITELIGSKPENKSTEDHRDYVWRLENKYYKANVRLHPLLDGNTLDPTLSGSIEAHLIYITEDECMRADVAALVEERVRGGGGAEVRLVAAACGAEPSALLAAAALARYELVLMKAAPAPPAAALAPAADSDDEGEARGVERLRDALQAHVWPGLDRTRSGPASLSILSYLESEDESAGSSDESWSSWRAAGDGDGDGGGGGGAGVTEEQCVERAEAFAGCVRAAGAAAAAARAGGGEGAAAREQRLQRAEALVAAFCRALGADL